MIIHESCYIESAPCMVAGSVSDKDAGIDWLALGISICLSETVWQTVCVDYQNLAGIP